MVSDPELAALVQQAARNLETLELLVRSAGETDPDQFDEFRQRLRDLQIAYVQETDALTHQVLKRAVERRGFEDRRTRGPQLADAGTGAHGHP